MAKLSNTTVYGDLNVSDKIYCDHIYVDSAGDYNGNVTVTIGDQASNQYSYITDRSLMLHSVNQNNNSPALQVYNQKCNDVLQARIGARLDQYLELGVSYNSTTSKTTGELTLLGTYETYYPPSGQFNITNDVELDPAELDTRAIDLCIGDVSIMTVYTGGVTVNQYESTAGKFTVTGSLTADPSTNILYVDNFESATFGTFRGPIGIGYANPTGTTEATRLYMGDSTTYMHYNSESMDSGGTFEMNRPVGVLDAEGLLGDGVIDKQGFYGPQIGFEPYWFDDFNLDHSSEYNYSGFQEFRVNHSSTTPGRLEIQKQNVSHHIPGFGYLITGASVYQIELPIKNSFNTGIGGAKYFTMRYRSKSADKFFEGFTVYWSNDATYSEINSQHFDMEYPMTTGVTYRDFYEQWCDLSLAESAWTDFGEVTNLKLIFDNPDYGEEVGDSTTGSALTFIDYLGVGHRGYETRFTSSDAYFWNDLTEFAGNISVGGDISGTIKDTIGFSFDGGGDVIATGTSRDYPITHEMELIGYTLISPLSGSITIDLDLFTYANYPTSGSTEVEGIGIKPGLSGNCKYQDTSLADWNTTLSANTVLRATIDTVNDIEDCTLILEVERTI
jgi:hypothetical protein